MIPLLLEKVSIDVAAFPLCQTHFSHMRCDVELEERRPSLEGRESVYNERSRRSLTIARSGFVILRIRT